MLIKTPNKELAFKAVINTWLRDKTIYCNSCGQIYPKENPDVACCETPQVGNNQDIFLAIVKQNKELSKSRMNEYGSNKAKNFRWGLSVPVSLHNVLDNFKKMHGQKGLFQEEGEVVWFMKKFPCFKVGLKA